MAPNVRGPDKQKRKRTAATFKQNARTQRKKQNNKLAKAAEGTARLDAFIGTRGTSQGEPKNTVPEAVDDADDAGNKVQARPHRNVSVSTTQAGDGTATRGSQQNTPGAERKVMSAGGSGGGGGGGDGGLVLSASWEAYVIVCHHHQPGAERDDGRGEWL